MKICQLISIHSTIIQEYNSFVRQMGLKFIECSESIDISNEW